MDRFGITPACAGSRSTLQGRRGSGPDHPRVRGEQTIENDIPGSRMGSPPRARGAGVLTQPTDGARGITPACAGSRRRTSGRRSAGSDHPRVRGEQFPPVVAVGDGAGSPPRARGAGRVHTRELARIRITPACAGSRGWRSGPAWRWPDHPRVRGEQLGADADQAGERGSPPRARGAAHPRAAPGRFARITPACAGSSSPRSRNLFS